MNDYYTKNTKKIKIKLPPLNTKIIIKKDRKKNQQEQTD